MRTLPQRFEGKYIPEPNSGCFIWTGSVDVSGYGRLKIAGRNWKANRVPWLIEHGDPCALHVLHRCDNRLCVNAAHLFLGTNADNVLDMAKKGRVPNAKLNGDKVRVVRALFSKGISNSVIARAFDVSTATIANVRSGRGWYYVA